MVNVALPGMPGGIRSWRGFVRYEVGRRKGVKQNEY